MKKKRISNKHKMSTIIPGYPTSIGYGLDGNFGMNNVLENDSLLKYYVDEAFQEIGAVWNIKSDTWGGKNRHGVIRRFSGSDAKPKARAWARDNAYKSPKLRGHELKQGIERGSDHKPHDIEKTTKETTLQERNYKQEYQNYHSKPEQKKRRAQRNHARRKMMRNGRVRKGDGKDVHHRDRNTKNNSSNNLSVTSKSYNRSKNK